MIGPYKGEIATGEPNANTSDQTPSSLRLADGRLLQAYTVHLKSNAGARTEKDALSNREKRQDAARLGLQSRLPPVHSVTPA